MTGLGEEDSFNDFLISSWILLDVDNLNLRFHLLNTSLIVDSNPVPFFELER